MPIKEIFMSATIKITINEDDQLIKTRNINAQEEKLATLSIKSIGFIANELTKNKYKNVCIKN